MTPSYNHSIKSGNLAWWTADPQPTSTSPSSSVYSTPSEKALALEQDMLGSAATTTANVYGSVCNRPESPGKESRRNESVISAASTRNSSTERTSSYNLSQRYLRSRQKHESTSDSDRWSQYSSAASTSHSSGQQEPQGILYDTSTSCKTDLSEAVLRDFGASLVEKLNTLEENLHTLSSLSAVASHSRGKERGVDIGVQTNLPNQQEQRSPKDQHNSYCNTLEGKITYLTNTNTNLASLNALLSADLCTSQHTIHDLQKKVYSLREEKLGLERRHGSCNEQSAQIELQIDLIRQMGVLLGRKEEQLESERLMMRLYKERITAVETEVEWLRAEWERVLPLLVRSNNEPVLTTVEMDKNT